MAAFYWTPPSAQALALAGIRSRPSLFKRPSVEVPPELADAFALFVRNQTQWRVGAGGPVGLDYLAMYADLQLHGVPRKRQRQVMEMLRMIERAALEYLHKS